MIVIETVSLPPVLDPVTVYDADDVMAVGVPLIAPVELSMDSPEGRGKQTKGYSSSA